MKKLVLALAVILSVFSCKTEKPLPANTYEITVSAKGLLNGLRAYIKTQDVRREVIIDTAIVMNERFVFNGKVAGPAIRVITVNGINGMLPFVLEEGRMQIELKKDSIFYSTIEGSKTNDDHAKFKKAYNAVAKKISDLRLQINRDTDRKTLSEINKKRQAYTDELENTPYKFIAEHPDSEFSLLLLEAETKQRRPNLQKIKTGYESLQNVINKNDYLKGIGNRLGELIRINEARATSDIGKIAPNFTSPTPEGKMLSLNDIKGKATIIDFWASWCGPCRRENPNVVKIYEKYHDKGLEIISVSLDKPGQKDRWLKAIKDDNLTWHHVGSLQHFREPVAQMYRVSSIPATFILDETGKIVAKKLRGKALEDQIAKMLD